MLYRDEVRYREEITEFAFRDNAAEINKLRAEVKGFRVCANGCWSIVSCQGRDCGEDEKDLAEKMLSYLKDRTVCRGLAEGDMFKGHAVLGTPPSNLEELLEVASGICEEYRGAGVSSCEFVGISKHIERIISRDYGEAVEEKVVLDLMGAIIVERGGRRGFGSYRIAFVPTTQKVAGKFVEYVLKKAYEKALSSVRARPLNPLAAGRATLVLSPEAAAALFHELSHALEGHRPAVARGARIGPPELELVDEPRNPLAPSIRFFDDEGIATSKRFLVEAGTVVDYHHTRHTAFVHKSKPGSAYGLFRVPTPFHTTLVVGRGDWGDREIVEETPRGFYIDGVAMAVFERGLIRLVPENAFVIERHEIRQPIMLRSIKIPLAKLSTISAIGRRQLLRVSDEKDHLVSEIAPHVRLEGYVE